ncbi:MAG: AIR synthase family protein, partial [Deltaproteobacteria bacterium]|nr:AIR synthase family protein [Deltaproteobacteria bacterium]
MKNKSVNQNLPVGKLSPLLLSKLLKKVPISDKNVIIKPDIGIDCAVVDIGNKLLVIKSDPITFATNEIGWYLVQVNVNDIATTGAMPKWLLTTLLLPENQTTPSLVEEISDQINAACRELNISVIGGHTEITSGLSRPIIIGTIIGEVDRGSLITPQKARQGDRILLTKGVPIEATAILAREFSEQLQDVVSKSDIRKAANFLKDPGISILRDARIAIQSGKVTAMHDPTEGGLLSALWELAIASQTSLYIDLNTIHVPALSSRLCKIFSLNPLAAIASGALLLTVDSRDASKILHDLQKESISCVEIGEVRQGPVSVFGKEKSNYEKLNYPDRDEIVK